MVILIECSGAYHFVAIFAAEAFGMVVLVTVTCTLPNNSFVAYVTNFGKPLDMAFLTVRLVVVCNKRYPCQLPLTTCADKAIGMVCSFFILHSFIGDWFIAGCTPHGTLTIITYHTEWVTLMFHKRLIHQREIAQQTSETSAMPEFIVGA